MPDTQTLLMLATGVFLVLNGITGATTSMEDVTPWPTNAADQEADDSDDEDASNTAENDSETDKTTRG